MTDLNKLKFTKPKLMKSWVTERFNVQGPGLVVLNMMMKILERDGQIEISLADENVGGAPYEPIPYER